MEKVRRILAILVAVFMVAAFAGCGSNASDNQTGGKTESLNTDVQQENGVSTTPQKEPVTLKCYIAAGVIPITPGIQDDPVAKEIERATGVTMDIMVGSSDQTKVMVASGDLADISVFSDITTTNSLIKAGSILPLDEYLTNVPNI